MRVEQALFTSARTRKVQGYHLVARSSGVDEPTARALTRWGPSHAALVSADPGAVSLNFHPLDQGFLAVSRTVYGGPEYSARGGLQIITHTLLIRQDHLEGYDYSAVLLARVAMALGYLRFDADEPSELPPVELPRRCVLPLPEAASYTGWEGLMTQLLRSLSDNGRTCVVGRTDPLALLTSLYLRTAPRRRLDVSFTTGLKPSLHRPFRVHFLPAADTLLQHQLASQGITVIAQRKPG